MGIFDFIRGKTQTTAAPAGETRSLADPSAELFTLLGGAVPASSGASVNPSTAMACTALRCAVESIAESVATLPAVTYERGSGDSRTRATDHPVFDLLRHEANPWTPANMLLEAVTRDALLWGNGYALVVRDGAGTPRELHRIHPTRVDVTADETTGEPKYTITEPGGQQRAVIWQDLVHIRAPGTVGIKGQSPVIECREAIGLCLTIERHVAKLFGRGGRPAGALRFKTKLGNEVATRIKASWQSAFGGENAGGGTAVLEEDAEYQPIQLSSVDAQTLELWAFSVLEIARIYRVPPAMLMDFSRATWTNAETGGQQFLSYALQRWLDVWTGEIRLKLFKPDERDRFYTEFLTDALLRSDFATRATAYGKYRSMGVMTANEVRAGLNLPPLPGGDVLQNPFTTSNTSTGGPTDGK